jgi:hypothetical protein
MESDRYSVGTVEGTAYRRETNDNKFGDICGIYCQTVYMTASLLIMTSFEDRIRCS